MAAMLRSRRRLIALLAATWHPAHAAPAAALTVAAAADLRFALDEVLAPFRAARAGTRIDVIYGSSGKLATQIRNGAPFDLLLSADREFADALHRDGFAAGAPRPYAVGRLAVWSTEASLGRLPLPDLVRHPRMQRLAIANPEHAPYGRAAMQALQSSGLWAPLQARLVLGENVSQAAQFALSGSAQGGIFAYSLALAPAIAARGRYVLIPEAMHQPLRQRMVLLRKAGDTARAFYAYLQQSSARAVLKRHGFVLPGETAG